MIHRTKVWDLGIRLFHWALVAAFATAWITSEDESDLHFYAGYMVCALLLFRIVWGVVGTRFARFASFIFSPKVTLEYAKSMTTDKPQHYLGHNPVGALMVFALLLNLTAICVTGLALKGLMPGIDARGPHIERPANLEQYSEVDKEAWFKQAHATIDADPILRSKMQRHRSFEAIHDLLADVAMALIVLHILGVLFATWKHKEKLIPAMITGWKDTEQ